MKVVILAGGLGTRLSEETAFKPKPMVEIGGQPILWHIMKIYAAQGFTEFVVALGYKGEAIKDYFVNYRYHARSLTVHLETGHVEVHPGKGENWVVHLLDTGAFTQTGGRLKRAAEFIGPEPFMATYGDAVSNIDLRQLLKFHQAHGKRLTITAIRPPARFGNLEIINARVARFVEKPANGEEWVSGGFFVMEPEVINYLAGDETIWEREPIERLAAEGQVMAYQHQDFWQCMDALRDVRLLQTLWDEGRAPWQIWQ